MKEYFDKIAESAFLDELQKLSGASAGALAKMYMGEMKGLFPKGTSLAEANRGMKSWFKQPMKVPTQVETTIEHAGKSGLYHSMPGSKVL